jgi:hypothetical protein
MKSKCFDLHLFYNQGSWTLLHAFTGHLFLFLWEFLLNSCAHFFIGGVDSLGTEFFLIPYRFWILDHYQMSNWQRFSPMLWAVSWVWWLFPLLYRSSLVWCSPICSLLLRETIEFCSGSHSYTYHLWCISYCFLELFQSFRPYIKVFDPLELILAQHKR